MTDRPDQGPRWPPAAFIFVLVMCLVYATGSAKHANASLEATQAALAQERNLVEQMTTSAALVQRAHDSEVAELRGIIIDRDAEIEDLEAGRPKTHIREDRETPVFAHEWTYPESKR